MLKKREEGKGDSEILNFAFNYPKLHLQAVTTSAIFENQHDRRKESLIRWISCGVEILELFY